MSGQPKLDRHRQKTVTIRVPLKVLDALRGLAKRNGHTLLGEAGLAIKAHLKGAGSTAASQRR
jgi:hypothetical protein